MIYAVVMLLARREQCQHAGWISASTQEEADTQGRVHVEKECVPYCGPAAFIRADLMTDEQIIKALNDFPQ